MEQTQKVIPIERLLMAMVFTAPLYVLLIFGVSFKLPDAFSNTSKSMEVTLVQHETDQADPDADFLADANQQGSGSEEDALMMETTEQSEFEDNLIHRVDTRTPIVSLEFQKINDEKVLTTEEDKKNKVDNASDALKNNSGFEQNVTEIQLSSISDIATLNAMLTERRQELAKRPRVRTLTAMSTKKAIDAAYVLKWREKVERVGNVNYPEESRKQRIYGDVRVVVTITSDGKVKSTEIAQSSGHKVLDDAARRIILMSSPFEPFPKELKAEVDILEIIRTWRFEPGNKLSSQN